MMFTLQVVLIQMVQQHLQTTLVELLMLQVIILEQRMFIPLEQHITHQMVLQHSQTILEELLT